MIKVSNRKVVRDLSIKSGRANQARNRIAIATIILTTVLFTSLFTMMESIKTSTEQQLFRQVGGDFHGTFKNLPLETMEELSDDPLIKKEGKRLLLGMLFDGKFQKQHTEISYMDAECAKGYFCEPQHGHLPKEGTMEFACDTKVLELLGEKPEIGKKFSIPYYTGSYADAERKEEAEFTLSGWWEHDPAINCAMVIVPLSYAEKIAGKMNDAQRAEGMGVWDYNVNFKSARNIEGNMKKVLEHHGFQCEDSQKENYIDVGINWAYMQAQMNAKTDLETVVSEVALLVLFVLTGYLIIYNIFQISVVQDIQFYGLLKTIGTTRKQLRAMIYRQAGRLCVVAIPVGLVIGYACGCLLLPFVASGMFSGEIRAAFHPWIFAAAALFSLLTVFISVHRPSRIAGKVSPVEAVKYVEVDSVRRKRTKSKKSGAISQMAFSNLGRNRKKTAMVMISFAMTIVIFHLLITLTNGLDMNKFVGQFVTSDYLIADSNYFQYNWGYPTPQSVSEEDIQAISSQDGIKETGRVYGTTETVKTVVDEDYYRKKFSDVMTEEEMEQQIKNSTVDGMLMDFVQLYGMEGLPLSKLRVIDGDISLMSKPGERYILAVYEVDDYGNVIEGGNRYHPGDKVKLSYESWKYFNIKTGKDVPDSELSTIDVRDESIWNEYDTRLDKAWSEEYTVAASVVVPNAISYRIFGDMPFILNAEYFKKDVKKDTVLNYIIDMEEGKEDALENFLADYTEQVNSSLDYESRAKYLGEFDNFRNMFLIIGGSLCAVVGLIGLLNFLYVMITSVFTRKREFAMLRSVGMTLKQLRKMIVLEGVWYSVISVAVSLVLCLIMGFALQKTLGSMFWFFSYHFTMTPFAVIIPLFLAIGIAVPAAVFHSAGQDSIVDEMRRVENG